MKLQSASQRSRKNLSGVLPASAVRSVLVVLLAGAGFMVVHGPAYACSCVENRRPWRPWRDRQLSSPGEWSR